MDKVEKSLTDLRRHEHEMASKDAEHRKLLALMQELTDRVAALQIEVDEQNAAMAAALEEAKAESIQAEIATAEKKLAAASAALRNVSGTITLLVQELADDSSRRIELRDEVWLARYEQAAAEARKALPAIKEALAARGIVQRIPMEGAPRLLIDMFHASGPGRPFGKPLGDWASSGELGAIAEKMARELGLD